MMGTQRWKQALVLTLVLMGFLLSWNGWRQYEQLVERIEAQEPFLDVSNRSFSLFLWQFSSYMRMNVARKGGYLPGFHKDRPNFFIEEGEQRVIAPPEVLFLYHLWNRLIFPKAGEGGISPLEFREFLSATPEWDIPSWKHAPEGYRALLEEQRFLKEKDLAQLSLEQLPFEVRVAFLGWRRYYLEGEKINQWAPSKEEVVRFIQAHPEYARSLWRNIGEVEGQPVAGLGYLSFMLTEQKMLPGETAPRESVPPFLRFAMFQQQ